MPTKKPLKKARSTREPRPDKSKFASMIEAATVDAYDESEQTAGWYTMFDEHLALPFETTILGAAVKVTKLELRGDNTIVATCTRGRERQAIDIVDLPLPTPKLRGFEWIEAYRHWRGNR
jgi:hypothetical protein